MISFLYSNCTFVVVFFLFLSSDFDLFFSRNSVRIVFWLTPPKFAPRRPKWMFSRIIWINKPPRLSLYIFVIQAKKNSGPKLQGCMSTYTLPLYCFNLQLQTSSIFWQKFGFLAKISIFFLKFGVFYWKFRFLTKMSIVFQTPLQHDLPGSVFAARLAILTPYVIQNIIFFKSCLVNLFSNLHSNPRFQTDNFFLWNLWKCQTHI